MPHLRSDKERKAMFSNMKGSPSRDSAPLFTRPKLTKRMNDFISREIGRQKREGKSQKQSIAIAFSKARKRFGNGRLKQ